MTSPSRDGLPEAVAPGHLSRAAVDDLLELRLIASLATLAGDGLPHVVAMWFRREGDAILLPTSQYTRKARHLRRDPRAAVMIDLSRSGLDLRGVQIRGRAELVEGVPARRLNRSIHERYVTEIGLADPLVAGYLSAGDDLTIRVPFDEVLTWNLAERPAGVRLRRIGATHPLDL